ncbi:MAG: ABC transporter ATP-binding protein [bacterium]
MIRFERVGKIYPGQASPAVRDLSLTVPEGSICVLIGPSGSGKTTILKMVNRLIEPTSGIISVTGQNVLEVDPVQLRRGIGYVIQQVGLFFHLTIFENVATVPRLLGWDEARIARRVDELLALVGMDSGEYRHRYPRQLSGGQAQRVGVARALAADPPVMLMDEPFGALDPITREHLQDEFLKIQRQIRKTILFVTHDIDEAIKMGDYLCILRDGQIVQFGTPDEILARPAGDFVAAFVGAGRTLKRLELVRVETVMARAPDRQGPPMPGAPAVSRGPGVRSDASLTEALSVMLDENVADLTVTDEQGRAVGHLTLDDIRRVARRPVE